MSERKKSLGRQITEMRDEMERRIGNLTDENTRLKAVLAAAQSNADDMCERCQASAMHAKPAAPAQEPEEEWDGNFTSHQNNDRRPEPPTAPTQGGPMPGLTLTDEELEDIISDVETLDVLLPVKNDKGILLHDPYYTKLKAELARRQGESAPPTRCPTSAQPSAEVARPPPSDAEAGVREKCPTCGSDNKPRRWCVNPNDDCFRNERTCDHCPRRNICADPWHDGSRNPKDNEDQAQQAKRGVRGKDDTRASGGIPPAQGPSSPGDAGQEG